MHPDRVLRLPLSSRLSSGIVRSGSSLAVAAVLGLGLAACGGDSTDSTDSAAASPSASASASDGTSASATPSAEAPAGDEEARQEYVDAVRQAADQQDVSVRTRITSTVVSGQQEIETVVNGVTSIEDGEITARLDTRLPEGQGGQGGQGGQELQTRIVDGSLYVQAPGIPEGKFQQIDLEQAGQQFGEQFQQQLDSLDPNAQGAAAIEAIQSVERVGEATVDGDDVTEYRVTLDFAGYAASQGNQMLQQLQQSGAAPQTVVAVNSLDDEGRIRRSVVELEVQGSQVRTVAEFLDYGVEVDVTAPAQRNIVQTPAG